MVDRSEKAWHSSAARICTAKLVQVMDMITAFLNTLPTKSIYFEKPKEYEKVDTFFLFTTWSLAWPKSDPLVNGISLYEFSLYLEDSNTESDHSLVVNEETRLIFSVYVDDQLDQWR